MAVVAEKEHERPIDPCLNDAPVWSAVNIDACFTPGIFVAKQCRGGPAEGVAEYPHACHVEPSRELAGCIRGVQLRQPIKDKCHVRGPSAQDPVRANVPLLARTLQTKFRVVLRNPPD